VTAPRSREELVERRELLDEAGIQRALHSLGESLTAMRKEGPVALVGIRTGGLHLAKRLRALLGEPTVPLGAIDISLYRDDVFEGLPRPEVGPTELPFPLPGVTIVLVDDVLYTGRTIRSALDALMDYGRPRAVRLAVLVDRGHRELPVQPDLVGLRAPTSREETVKVLLREAGEPTDRVVVRARRESP
jgi:pyrimidine operon attenuation protein / uracil phosphoribosyltransferase